MIAVADAYAIVIDVGAGQRYLVEGGRLEGAAMAQPAKRVDLARVVLHGRHVGHPGQHRHAVRRDCGAGAQQGLAIGDTDQLVAIEGEDQQRSQRRPDSAEQRVHSRRL